MSGSTILLILVAIVVVVALVLLGLWLLRGSRTGRSLRDTGDRALARVMRVEALEGAPGGGVVRCSIAFQLEPLAGGRAFDRQKTLNLPQHRVPRLGEVWPAWYRSTDPAAFEVEVPDPDNAEQAELFRTFGLQHPRAAHHAEQSAGSPAPPDSAPAQQPTSQSAVADLRSTDLRSTDRPKHQADEPQTAPDADPRAGAHGATPVPDTTRQPKDDPVIELERLIRLHDNGSITDEEFAAAKAKYLRE